MSIFNKVKKYRNYRKTVHELRSLSMDLALDLDIYPGDAKKLARRAVWGA